MHDLITKLIWKLYSMHHEHTHEVTSLCHAIKDHCQSVFLHVSYEITRPKELIFFMGIPKSGAKEKVFKNFDLIESEI